MAYKDRGEIAWGNGYNLGDYNFSLERTSVPGSTNDQITAVCRDGEKSARKSVQVKSSTQINGWRVEANETEATVYMTYDEQSGGGGSGYTDWTKVAYSPGLWASYNRWIRTTQNVVVIVLVFPDTGPGHDPSIYDHSFSIYVFSANSNEKYIYESTQGESSGPPSSSITPYNGIYYYKTVDGVNYYGTNINGASVSSSGPTIPYYSVSESQNNIETAFEYALQEMHGETVRKEILVGRFAIDIEDAGGVGPGGGTGGGWTDPGDYDPDWEPGDPTHTLYVTVTGALSGRHNDPIEDPSYSYIPADKDTVKDYGCGGDGGHGGGGGAGASTVVVHKFATNQANSKEVTAIARRHGYGSGGGKGGKGGDGCILVYY